METYGLASLTPSLYCNKLRRVSSKAELRSPKTTRLENRRSHKIRVHIRRGSTVFKVSATIFYHRIRNADRCVPCSISICEFVHRRSLVFSCKSRFIVVAVDFQMFFVRIFQFGHTLQNFLNSVWTTHCSRTEVSVTP